MTELSHDLDHPTDSLEDVSSPSEYVSPEVVLPDGISALDNRDTFEPSELEDIGFGEETGQGVDGATISGNQGIPPDDLPENLHNLDEDTGWKVLGNDHGAEELDDELGEGDDEGGDGDDGNDGGLESDDDGGENGEWDNPRHARFVAPLRSLEAHAAQTTDPAEAEILNANVVVLREAAAAGVEILDSSDVQDDEVAEMTSSLEVYNVAPSRDFTYERVDEVTHTLSERGILKLPETKRLLDTPYDELRAKLREQGPFLLARTDLELGKGKYLIDDRRQVDTLGLLLEEEGNHSMLQNFAVTDFIPTPSDRYTSFKIISNPRGDLVAATLVYSGHSKTDYDHMLNEIADLSETDDIMRMLLEHPDSSAFLGAKQIGSYSDAESRLIALMGPNAGNLRPGEDEILAAHGIDPAHPVVPDVIREQTKYLQPLTSLAGLTSSLDFVQHADTGDIFFLEPNSGPGATPYAQCWLDDPHQPDRYTAMYRAAAQRVLRG